MHVEVLLQSLSSKLKRFTILTNTLQFLSHSEIILSYIFEQTNSSTEILSKATKSFPNNNKYMYSNHRQRFRNQQNRILNPGQHELRK